MPWPDVVATLVVGLGALRGWWNGLVGEFMGLLSILVSIFAGFFYGGQLDDWVAARTHLGPAPSHALGMSAFCAIAYAAVTALSFSLRSIRKMPVIGLVNSIGGASIGGAKWVTFL